MKIPILSIASTIFLANFSTSFADDQVDAAAKLLSMDFASFVKTTKREIVTYNYRKRELLKLSDSPKSLRSDSPEALKYAKEWTNTIKEFTPNETGYLGWGLYTSNNPISSQDFADDEEIFGLVTQKYKVGAKFLDLRSLREENAFPISKETLSFINKICYLPARPPKDKATGPDSFSLFTKLFIGRDKRCNEVFVKALENLKIDSILYSWKDEDFSICDAQKTYASFINVNGELSSQTVELIVNPTKEVQQEAKLIKEGKKKPQDFSLGKATYEAYQKAAVFINSKDGEQTKYGKILEDFEPGNQKQKDLVVAKIKKEAFGCDKKYEKEDAPFFDADLGAKLAIKEGLSKVMSNFKINEVNTNSCK